MIRAIFLTLLLDLSVGTLGNECAAGYKHKADLTGLKCIDNAKTAASCNSECCEKDANTCGGLADTVTCAFGSYAAGDDAWKKTAATKANKNTACCTAQASCAAATCPAGMKKAAAHTNTKCASDAASCAQNALCCEQNKATCGGTAVPPACGAGKFVPVKPSDAWKNIATKDIATDAGADFKLKCCVAKATCSSSYAVPAGYKKKAGVAATECASDADSCVASPAFTCVEKDATKCGGQVNAITCATPATSYYPTTNDDKVFAAGQSTTDCCVARATCKQATCPSGHKKKTGTDALACATNVASCTTKANLATCCEADASKCGGLTGISCAYGFFDESLAWNAKTTQSVKDVWNNKAANSTNKNTNCCSPREVCKVPVGTTTPTPVAAVVTTTPAAPVATVVTTTPAAPALKYSEQKVDFEKGSDHPMGANMVWLGVGGLIGMGVLAGVQGLRSKMQAYTRLA